MEQNRYIQSWPATWSETLSQGRYQHYRKVGKVGIDLIVLSLSLELYGVCHCLIKDDDSYRALITKNNNDNTGISADDKSLDHGAHGTRTSARENA